MKKEYRSKDGERRATVIDFKGGCSVSYYYVSRYGVAELSSTSPTGTFTKTRACRIARDYCN